MISMIAILPASAVAAQGRGLDITYGKWWSNGSGGAANVVTASLNKHWFGPVSWGVGVNHVSDQQSLVSRSITGGEAFLRFGGVYGGPYAVGAFGIGRQHNQSNIDGQWSLGAGYAHDALSFLRLTGEARYRVEDQLIRGFWARSPSDRGGIMVNAGLTLRFGRSPARRPPTPVIRPPIRRPPEEATEAGGDRERNRPALSTTARLPRAATAIAANVVETAVNVMGSPYRWGGTDANGFDCSGLIQYAYARHGIIVPRVSRDQARHGEYHGIIVPRVSRDQARHGEYVEPKVERLRPGDVLGFAITGGRVSHVGLYIGDGQFIHSSSGGVRLSNLNGTDGNSLYYQRRWVVARRVLND